MPKSCRTASRSLFCTVDASIQGLPSRLLCICLPLSSLVLQVGTSVPCQQYLKSTWAVCSNSVQLGTGQGSVAIKLPKPSAVDSFTARPGSITSSDDPAALSPMLVATSSALELQIAFNDGVVRDFSTDRRVAYGLAPGSTMCEVVRGEFALQVYSNL